MKIVDRKTFLAMPAGTVFAEYEPCVFGDLAIKGDSIFFDRGDDFFYQQIVGSLDADNCGEWSDLLLAAEEGDESIPVDFETQGRDGLFDPDQLFAVFESEDVLKLINRLLRTLPATGEAA